MKSLIRAVKSVFIILMFVLLLGLSATMIKNCTFDNPSDSVPVEDITLDETEIMF